MIKNITLGSDPEFAILNSEGTPVSGVGFLPGTKEEPFPLNDYVSCQTDNVGAETCIPPCDNEDDFVKYIQMSRDLTEQKLRELQPDWSLASLSSARYSDEQLDSEQARTFGCDPSFDIYKQAVSRRPSPEEVGNLRSFGFHIHIGYQTTNDQTLVEVAEKLIRAMDMTCGIYSIVVDTDTDRRSIYGNAGDFRMEKLNNGIDKLEYRTLGAAMHATEEHIRNCFRLTMNAVDITNNWADHYETLSLEAQEIIDTGNTEAAITFMNNNKTFFINTNVIPVYEQAAV